MRLYLSIAALALGCLGWTSLSTAGESPIVDLAASRPAAAGDSFRIQVTTGVLPRGARLLLVSEAGKILGAITPFPPGRAITGAVPVPASAVANGHVRLRLEVIEQGAAPRAPRPGEVERLELIVVPGGG